ncbi:L-lactate permease [Scopulibacillus cellulosilyticus]|uniref:L-lactate permease n=1 Tax=Scopulibacillus cellulosilyticus TaxID=2665665 RepID=A0ABW2PW87_9BACL
MNWIQNYNPLGNMLFSFIVALIPLLFFFWTLAIKKMKGHIAALWTILIAIIDAVIIFHMPILNAIESTFYGAANGLWPIGYVIVAAVFLYKLTLKSGKFEVMKNSIASLTEDRRLQALLIAFSFGAFLEGAAGFGAPVAIAGALLAGLGFNPFYAAGLCLIANTAPVAFGSLGAPILTAAQVSGLSPEKVGVAAGDQLLLLSIFIPFWLIFIMAGWKKTIEVLPAILICGISFAITQFITSHYLGPQLPNIASSIVSLVCLALFLKVWKPKSIYRFKDDNLVQGHQLINKNNEVAIEEAATIETVPGYTLIQILTAWSPFIILIILVAGWGAIDFVKNILNLATIEIPVPGLNNAILKAKPIVDHLTPYTAIFKFDILGAAGSAIMITAVISKFILKISWKTWGISFVETLKELRIPLTMIASVLGLAYLVNYSGMSATLGLGLAQTGKLFPLFAPLLGWIGVFLTGSDASSNALFGNLQKITGSQMGLDPTLLVAANSSGGVTGKMISPQSIAIATAATGMVGKEGNLLRFTIKHSLFLVAVVMVITYIQAYFL